MEVRGQKFTVLINDQALGEIEFPEGVQLGGMTGLVLQSADADGLRARFDNFKLEESLGNDRVTVRLLRAR